MRRKRQKGEMEGKMKVEKRGRKESDEGERRKEKRGKEKKRVKRGRRRKKTSKKKNILMWALNLVHQCLNNLNWSEIGGRFMCRTVWA